MVIQFFIWFSILNVVFQKDNPPIGTVRINENLFMDKNEISIVDYREYLSWLQRIFGRESNIYQKMYPDTSVLSSLARNFNEQPDAFLYQPRFNYYPIVGISFQQATNFCQWRSDRVFELILVSNQKIPFDTTQNADNFFTIKKYRDQHPSEITPYPEYRLPTIEEWNEISTHKRVIKKFNYKLEPREESHTNKIFNLFGSVSEMTATIGTSRGGSYRDDKFECKFNMTQHYSGPSEWLGFRCVCTWKQ